MHIWTGWVIWVTTLIIIGAGCTSHRCDRDADGHISITCGGDDCADFNSYIHPGSPEICDDYDDNCSGRDSDRSTGPNTPPPDDGEDFADNDGDGYSICAGDCDDTNPNNVPDGPVGTYDQDNDGFNADVHSDCNDCDGATYPGATEFCDGIDQDCNGVIDDGFDADGDGYSVCQGDCDDGDAGVHPEAAEPIDGKDTNCDGRVDE